MSSFWTGFYSGSSFAQYQVEWKPQYRFQLVSRTLEDFQACCNYNQTDDHSIFKQRLICTQLTSAGRVTLSNRKLMITQNHQRQEKLIEDQIEYLHQFNQYFKIDLNIYSQQNINALLNFVFSQS